MERVTGHYEGPDGTTIKFETAGLGRIRYRLTKAGETPERWELHEDPNKVAIWIRNLKILGWREIEEEA